MNPFIDIEMSLSEQVVSLATFAHIAAALYLRHRTACLTGPLFADCQMVIKNIIFTIARLIDIDPNAELHIILEGTDRLEGLFGEVRTQDHARNFDIKQVSEKLSIATLLNEAWQRQPDLDRGHRRLSLKDCLGIDHVNPSSWKGDVGVGNVDLPLCCSRGREAAIDVLRHHFPEMNLPDFETLFKNDQIDLLRPSKSGYIGVGGDSNDKRSEVERTTPVANPAPAAESSTAPPTVGSQQPTSLDVPLPRSAVDEPMEVDPLPFRNGIEFVYEDPVDLYGDDYSSIFSVDDSDDSDDEESLEDDKYGWEIPIGVEIEDLLSDRVEDHLSGNPCPATPDHTATHDKYLEVDGKRYLKSSLVATLSSKYSKKVTMRVLRARGVAAETALTGSEDKRRFDDSHLDSDDLLKAGDLAAILAKTATTGGAQPRTVSLAVVEITGFREGSKLHASLHSPRLKDSSIKVAAQVLELKQTAEIGSEHEVWEWTGRFLKLNTSATDPVSTRRQYVIDLPGPLLYPVKPKLAERSNPPSLRGQPVLPITWELPSSLLDDTCEEAWDILSRDRTAVVGNLNALPVLVNPALFPYTTRGGAKTCELNPNN